MAFDAVGCQQTVHPKSIKAGLVDRDPRITVCHDNVE
jgi:hypothetical protein